jgi:hypothetical protein
MKYIQCPNCCGSGIVKEFGQMDFNECNLCFGKKKVGVIGKKTITNQEDCDSK